MRLFEHKTAVENKTQSPVWNRSFLINVPPGSKMIHLEVHDHVAGITKNKISRVKLYFLFVPRVEASFVDRSLIYSFDGTCQFNARELRFSNMQ